MKSLSGQHCYVKPVDRDIMQVNVWTDLKTQVKTHIKNTRKNTSKNTHKKHT